MMASLSTDNYLGEKKPLNKYPPNKTSFFSNLQGLSHIIYG